MATSNPAFRSAAFSSGATALAKTGNQAQQGMTTEQLDELYGRAAAGPVETDRMSYDDVIVKTAVSFAILLAGGVVGWMIPALMIPAAIAGFVLALINIFKKQPSPALVLSYAAVEGVFVGGISNVFNTEWEGIVIQAVLGTLAVVGITLALFASGKVRASKRATKVFLIAMIGYAVFSLVNFGLMAFGVTEGMFGLRSYEFLGIPVGAIIGVFVILMAAYSLVLDFDQAQQGVRNGAPRIFGWSVAFGIMITVVWLYVEILRLLAIFRE